MTKDEIQRTNAAGSTAGAGQLVEAANQVARQRAGLAAPNRSTVNLDHWNHFGRRAGEEALVGDVDIVLGKHDLAHVDAGLNGQLHYGITSHAFENPGVDRRG